MDDAVTAFDIIATFAETRQALAIDAHACTPAQTEEENLLTVLSYICFDSVISGMNIPEG